MHMTAELSRHTALKQAFDSRQSMTARHQESSALPHRSRDDLLVGFSPG